MMTHPSPLAAVYDAIDVGWRVEIGRPAEPGWMAGAELRTATSGPFNDLLTRIGQRSNTTDRRTIAALFALRFGWSSAMAIAPYLRRRSVPDVSLDNISFRFRESTFLERTAIHEPRGVVVRDDPRAAHPTMTSVDDDAALLAALRAALVEQARPVVDALYAWSGFAPRGTWGQLTSSWASHVTGFCDDRHDQRSMLPTIEALFAGHDIVAAMQPRMHAVTCLGVTHLFQRRASCCRYYLVPQGSLCASCPLVSHEERLERNRAWMKTQLEGRPRTGHSQVQGPEPANDA